MKRLLAAMTAALVTAALATSTVLAAPSFTQATGGIGMSSPSQYVSFNAFDYGATGDRGTINYTNFDYTATGTGVWNVGGTYPLVVSLGGADYTHTMTVTTVTPISPTATLFSGTGSFIADPSYTWTVTGMVSGASISFDIVYTGTLAGYVFHASGTIATDGSMSGTATDSLGRLGLTWATPSGSVHEVLSFSAPVFCVVARGADATFVYTIPAGFPTLSGLNVIVKVHDGGSPGVNHDTWGHNVTVGCADAAVNNYPIVSGNLVVH
jgi:hypothetical protein